jgi:repressor LexA
VTTLPTFAVGPRVAILACLSESLALRGYPPTLREIAEAVGMAHNTVEHHLSRLRAEGYVTWTDGQQRTLRFAEQRGAPCKTPTP